MTIQSENDFFLGQNSAEATNGFDLKKKNFTLSSVRMYYLTTI